jgi:hypothetical protein
MISKHPRGERTRPGLPPNAGRLRPYPVVRAMVWGVLLAAPSVARAQEGEERSVWQFAVRHVDWEAVEWLQGEVRECHGAGAMGAYELLIRANRERFDAMVTAEIVDPVRLARVRGLDMPAAPRRP